MTKNVRIGIGEGQAYGSNTEGTITVVVILHARTRGYGTVDNQVSARGARVTRR